MGAAHPRRTAAQRSHLAGPLSARLFAQLQSHGESRAGSGALPGGYRLWTIDRSLWHQTRLGAGSVARAQPRVACLLDAYHWLPVQSTRRGSCAPVGALGRLVKQLAHRVNKLKSICYAGFGKTPLNGERAQRAWDCLLAFSSLSLRRMR